MASSFAIIVQGALPDARASLSALAFARAAVDAGHTVPRVFFYHQGVTIAARYRVLPQDERNDADLWLEFARDSNCELAVCVTAAQRRGVIGADEAQRYALDGTTLRDGFSLVGLGQLLDMTSTADRTVTFPGTR
ncbi:MAG: sulfurtransferase complex subunit TusD [Pseudomonadota bacterium]